MRVVDDDPALLRSLALLLKTAGFRVATFDNADGFLSRHDDVPGCAVLDLRMAGMGGLDLQAAIQTTPNPVPVVFLTGRGDVNSSVSAMKGGAVDFLTKPVSDAALLDAVRRALAIDVVIRRDRHERAQLRARYESLTRREREVFSLIERGLLNKQIAFELGTSERTIKAHRANVMRKMAVQSITELARAADRLRDRGSPDD